MILDETSSNGLLLDTCAIIYLFNGEPMTAASLAALDKAATLVSPISAWEVGVLAKKATPSTPRFTPTAIDWFRQVLKAPGVLQARFDAEIALESCNLPEPLHRDPADRFLIATARLASVPIVTRDRLILAYASAGHVDAIMC